MMNRDYALISTGGTSDFENSFLNFLRDWPSDKPPKSYVIPAVPEDGDVDDAGMVLFTWRSTLNDMILAKGHLDLHIQHEALLENLGTYFHAAAEEGILPCQLDQDDQDDQIDPEDDEVAGGDSE